MLLFIASSFLHVQLATRHFISPDPIYFGQGNCPSWAARNLLHPVHMHTSSPPCGPGAQCIWGTSGVLRLTCTCTASPVLPTCTPLQHVLPCPSCPGLIASVSIPHSQHLCSCHPTAAWQPSTKRAGKTYSMAEGKNHPSLLGANGLVHPPHVLVLFVLFSGPKSTASTACRTETLHLSSGTPQSTIPT